MLEQQRAINEFQLKSNSKIFEKPENAVTFNNAWVLKDEIVGHQKLVTKEVISSCNVSELIKNCRESNLLFDWSPNRIEWSSRKPSDFFGKDLSVKRQLDAAEKILILCCPALEEFYERALIHVRYSCKAEDAKIPFCTWCGSHSSNKKKCNRCGAQARLLDKNSISCYECFFEKVKDKIEACQTHSCQHAEAPVEEECLKDIVTRMQKIQDHAVEFSNECDLQTFEDEIRKCILTFAYEKPHPSMQSRNVMRNPKLQVKTRSVNDADRVVYRTVKGVYVMTPSNTMDSSEARKCSPFSNKSIWHFSMILFEEYSHLRENFCVNYVINNTSLKESNSNKIRVFDIVDSGGNINLHGQLTYRKDMKVSYQEQEGSSVFSTVIPHITINSAAENVNTCFVGKSGALVLFTETKISGEVEICIAVPGSKVASFQIQFMPDVITYLDGTSQLIGIVYKMKEADGSVDWTQQKVIVYSYLCNTSQFQQFDLALHGVHRKWAVGDIIQMQFIPSAQKLTALDKQNIFHVWDWNSSQLEWQIEFDQELDTYGFSPDGECLFFFRRENEQNVIINLAKVELLKGLPKLSDTYMDFSNKHVLHSPCPLKQSYSVDIIAVSVDEVLLTVYSEDTLVVQNAGLQMDPKKLRYLESGPSENSEILVSKISMQVEQYADIFIKFATSLPSDLTLAETVLLPVSTTISDQQRTQIKDGMERIVHKRVAKQGKNTDILPDIKVIKECDNMELTCTLSRYVYEGEWVKQLILLLPVQIIRAQARRLYPVVNGVTLNVSLMDFGRNEEAVTKLSNVMTFGPLTSVILAHAQKVKIVASIGRTSTGKSFLLNHLTGTLFYVDPGRCTEGIWISAREVICKCSLCKGNKSLFISVDVEGLGSLTRSAQEDALLAQFTFALSSLVILNQREKAMDRGLKEMLIKLTSGMKVTKSGDVQNFVHGDDSLFKATFIIALKDISDEETLHILRQMSNEVHSCKAGSAELQKLFQKSPKSVTLPYQQKAEYYDTLTQSLFRILSNECECCFSSGFQFYLKCTTVLSSLVLSSSQPLMSEYQESGRMFIDKNYEEAEKTGNMKLRNPRFVVPDYPHGKLCILPLISNVQILPRQMRNTTEGHHCIGELDNHAVFVKMSTVPNEQISNLKITRTADQLEVSVERNVDQRGIKGIQISTDAVSLQDQDYNIVCVPDMPVYQLKLERQDDNDFQGQVFYLKDSDINIDVTSDERIRSLLLSVKATLEEAFPRNGLNEESWFLKITYFMQAIIERRQWRLILWPKMLAEEIGLSNGLLFDETKFLKRVRKLDTLKQLCGKRCKQQGCHYKCLLPHNMSIAIQCDCLNEIHHCISECSWECKDSTGMPKLCSLGAGHQMVSAGTSNDDELFRHKCDSQDHYCQVICSIPSCLNPCRKMHGHSDEHQCPESHPCHCHCSAPFCASPCKFQVNEPHEFCMCSQEFCTRPCEMPGCSEQCQVKDHFHSASESHVFHICSHRHECFIACSHRGICEVLQIRDFVKRHFKVGIGITEEHKVTIQKAQRHQCKMSIPEMQTDISLPKHSETHSCNMSHQCTVRCPLCQYFCQETVTINGDHTGKRHNTHHGEMIGAYYVSGSIHSKFSVKGNTIESSDTAFNQRCNMYCLEFPGQGRGHTHLCHEIPKSHQAAQLDSETLYYPDDRQPKKLVSHAEFWDRLKFEDPYSDESIKTFSKCNHHCRICECFCTGALGHKAFKASQAGSRGHVTGDGHQFPCKHPTHFVMIFDRSGSMQGKDIVPDPKLKCGKNLKNRLGTVLESSLLILQSLSKADSKVSLILFNFDTELCFEKQTAQTAIDHIRSTLEDGKVKPEGGTSFDKALLSTHLLLEGSGSADEYTVLLFLSDGECEVDLTMVDRLKQIAYLKLTMYAVHCARSAVGSSLKHMVDHFGNNSRAFHCTDRDEMRERFGTVATQINQQYHVLPKVHGFDPKIDLLEKRQNSGPVMSLMSTETFALSKSHEFNEIRNTFLRKAHPGGVFDECHGRKILVFGSDERQCKSLIYDAVRVNKMQLEEVEVDSNEAATKLLRAVQSSNPCLLLMTKISEMSNAVIATLQYVQLKDDSDCQTILVGVVTDLNGLEPSIASLFDANIHIPLPSKEERLKLLKDLHLTDELTEELLSLTYGLSFLQMNDITQQIQADKSLTERTMVKVKKMSQKGRETHNMIELFLLVSDKFSKADLHLEDRVTDDKNIMKEALKRLTGDATVSTLLGVVDKILCQRSFDKVCLIFKGLDGPEGKAVAKVIARFLNLQITEWKYIDSIGKLVADNAVKAGTKGIAYTEDLSLLRSLMTGSLNYNIGIATSLNESITELEYLSDIEIEVVEFQGPQLQTRRLYLSDYIHQTFKLTELSLNKEQDLYWLAFNTANASHKELKEIVQLAFAKSCREMVNAEYYQPLLFEKAEEPDYVSCKAMDYGAQSVEFLPAHAKLKPPLLNIDHLASALQEKLGITVANGKILSQVDPLTAPTYLTHAGGVVKARDQNLSARVIVLPNTVANDETLQLSLRSLSSTCFTPKLTEELDGMEVIASSVVHVGPVRCKLEAPVSLVLPVNEMQGCSYSKLKLMHSPTAYGKPTAWQCVLETDEATDSVTIKTKDDITFSRQSGSIRTTKLGLWTWIGRIPLQTVMMVCKIYKKYPLEKGSICTVRMVLTTEEQVKNSV